MSAVIPQWTFADRLRKARQTLGVRQLEFAALIDEPAPRYSQWEAGNNLPRDIVGVARRVSLATHVPATWLLGLDDEARPADGQDGQSVRPKGLEPPTFCSGVWAVVWGGMSAGAFITGPSLTCAASGSAHSREGWVLGA
jgi:transcriptional regulator with XRE-family HTH domain